MLIRPFGYSLGNGALAKLYMQRAKLTGDPGEPSRLCMQAQEKQQKEESSRSKQRGCFVSPFPLHIGRGDEERSPLRHQYYNRGTQY
ncbi:hypothetical protein NDU88_003793 [Pleurodeles waltl]|uniref:Uncharacterized protein n=1 Tax=Pleurodeles waltl TaxID=8319 RepID=A0AAV7T6L1_PLEWA|nr:hypothetical protein NDU88_003793 [Pleurodeles waltl]